ncbi:MMPL family transporter [Pseudomaricurvus sp. HS19]|uniref:MMPL family transporter n=1 Tax=Pseudomaricurvus sp. HS19 TaxID=2692626 RepID=UPI00136E8633|nr:MMPL family transporter [Pseudomaricurvus sp. HS19]MYM63977.1 MMPL family transporter [Pseudomaricurvus sp. HS19]
MSARWPALVKAWVWALLLLSCGGALGYKFSDANPGHYFDTNILALLPANQQAPLADLASERMADHFANDILLLVGAPKADDDELLPATRRLMDALNSSGDFTAVSSGGNSQLQQQLQTFYHPYRYQLLTPELRQLLHNGDQQALIRRSLQQLHSPMAPPRAAPFSDDPFNLLGSWLQQLQPAGGFRPDAWGLVASDADYQYRVVQASFAGSAYDPANQQRLLNAIDAAIATARLQEDDELRLLRSGLLFHAAAGAEQARSEMSTIGLGSLAGIVLLLFWYFRSPRPLLLPLLSIGAGLLLALTACLLLFGRVHIITLAFGASLVGVSVDYALHYLCAQRQLSGRALHHILPGITLGLITSVLAYSAQALTPFPGLRQMAVFAAIGLIGAWLTVVCWFPLLARAPSADTTQTSRLWPAIAALAARRRWLAALLLVAGLCALWGLSQLRFDDSLQNLQSSPAALLADEARVQQLSQRAGASRFLLLQADDAETLLQTEEALRQRLDTMVVSRQLHSYQALSQVIPSVARQQQDYRLVHQQLLQGQGIAHLFTTLGAGADAASASEAHLANHQPRWLTPDDWADHPISQLLPFLWLNSEASPGLPAAVSVISLGPVADPAVYSQLQALADEYRGVTLVNRVADISGLLASYRITVSEWMLLAAVAIALLLRLRYGRRGWLILALPLLSTLMTFGLLSLQGHPLTLFHLLAALLVLGIGLDTGIFLRESAGEPHAWDAVSLSALTSILAFGLLALSQTPVLHYFGATVLPGILLTWLLSLALRAGSTQTSPQGTTP